MHSDDRKVDPFAPDEDTPVWTDEEIARARPGREIFAELGIEPPRPRPRARSGGPKKRVRIPVDADVLEAFKATGPGWRRRMNDSLRALAPERRAAGSPKRG